MKTQSPGCTFRCPTDREDCWFSGRRARCCECKHTYTTMLVTMATFNNYVYFNFISESCYHGNSNNDQLWIIKLQYLFFFNITRIWEFLLLLHTDKSLRTVVTVFLYILYIVFGVRESPVQVMAACGSIITGWPLTSRLGERAASLITSPYVCTRAHSPLTGGLELATLVRPSAGTGLTT